MEWPAGSGFGGGLYVAGGTATLTNATVSSNMAQGGAGYAGAYVGGNGGNGGGGGLYVAAGTVTLTNVTLSSNSAQGGQGAGSSGAGGNGGNGLGGALEVSGGTASLTSVTVTSNDAQPGLGGDGGAQLGMGDGPGGLSGVAAGAGICIASGDTVYLDSFTLANTINNTDSTGLNGSTANIDGGYILTPAAGQPPIVAHAASANPSPVTGTTTSLSVLGADAAGAAVLTYTWAVTSALPVPPLRASAATAATPPRTPRPPSTAPAPTPSRSPSPTHRACPSSVPSP